MKEKHRLPERKANCSKRRTRILELKKRPENTDRYASTCEIVREKPKTASLTEQQKRLNEVQNKKEEKKMAIYSGFR